eukprot:sb/3475692/
MKFQSALYRDPFEAKYAEYIKEQLREKGSEKLLEYHDPDHGSDTEFEDPDMDVIEEHSAKRATAGEIDSEEETNTATGEPPSQAGKRRKLETTKDDGDRAAYQLRLSQLTNTTPRLRCIKGILD